MEVKGKRITVIGMGVSGRAVSLLLCNKGASVYAIDSNVSPELKATASLLGTQGVETCIGGYDKGVIRMSDIIVISPGIKHDSEILLAAKEKNIKIIGEIEAAGWFCESDDIIAVTGTNGKSTIVTLIGLMLELSGKKPVVCGNIGRAFSECVLGIRQGQEVVLELSSFQLKAIDAFKPRISLISNVTQNHLDWHADFDDYFSSKTNIYRNQDESGFCVLNYDDSRLRQVIPSPRPEIFFYSTQKKVKGAFIDGPDFVFNDGKKSMRICSVDDAFLSGRHNYSDILASIVCARLAGVSAEHIKKIISEFKGLCHRCEYVTAVNGVRYIDDSKSTSVGACLAALTACRGNVLLIAGGRDKGSDYGIIKSLIAEKVKAVVAIGESRDKIIKAFSGIVKTYKASCMAEAVRLCQKMSSEGDTVILSPMCSSFDMYSSYKARGDDFKNIVLSLPCLKSNRA